MKVRFSEIIKTFDVEPVGQCNLSSESLKFRVEILRQQDSASFYARVYRFETFRIQPTFPQSGGKPIPENQGDHEMLVLDEVIGVHELTGESVSEVLTKIENSLIELLML